MYQQKILNEFYEELFATDFKDYASPTQNEKTDSLCNDINISFDDWLVNVADVFCDDNGYKLIAVLDAIKAEPQFKKDLKREFNRLKEEVKEMLAEDEDDLD